MNLARPDGGSSWIVAIARWGLVATALLTAYFLVGDPWLRASCYVALGLGALACGAIGIRRHRPRHAGAWWLLTGGAACCLLGDAIWFGYDLAAPASVPLPSPADVAYLVSWPLYGAALVRFARVRGVSRRDCADAAALSVGIGTVALLPAIWGPLHDGAFGFAAIVSASYPLGSGVVLGGLMALILSNSARTFAEWGLLATFGAMLAADALYAGLVIDGGYAAGDLVDAGWLFGYAALGATALHPSMATVAARRPRRSRLRRRTAVLLLVLLSGPLASVGDHVPETVVASVWVVAFALVAWRILSLAEHWEERVLTDSLTGLANRRAASEHLADVLARLQPPNRVGVLFCDLDHFKIVNDGIGHGAGDVLLQRIAGRLREVVRPNDVVARLGGDEFVIIVDRAEDDGVLLDVAERVQEACAAPVQIEDHEIVTSVSIGIRSTSDPEVTAEAMLRDADAAMYAAKHAGRRRAELFQPAMRDRALQHLELVHDIRRGLAAGEFEAFFQPEICLDDGSTFGFEALARWRHPSHGLVPPADFIRAAEDAGMIDDVFEVMLATVCQQLASWRDAHGWQPLVALNLAPSQLSDATLADRISATLARWDVSAEQLWLELTESALAHDGDLELQLRRLRATGARIAIDDFGTGYSSLLRLQRLPVDGVKIDRGFVQRLGSPRDDAIVASIIDMAHALGAVCVAEGVETAEQAAALRALGCDVGQGYLWARPAPAADVDAPGSPGVCLDRMSTVCATVTSEPVAGH